MGASMFHNPVGLHGLLQGYLYLLPVYLMIKTEPISDTLPFEKEQLVDGE
jgi:hypothetical protein